MKLAYRSVGSGEPVILLHGFLGSSTNWLGFASRLKEDYNILMPDLRNHGDSPHALEITYPLMAGDIYDFFISHRLERASIIGHSMGGKAAMEFSIRYPDMVKSLVVLDIAPGAYLPRHEYLFPLLKGIDLKSIKTRHDADSYLKEDIPDRLLRMFLLKNLGRSSNGFVWKIDINALEANYSNIWAAISEGNYYGRALFLRGSESDMLSDKDLPQIKKIFPEAVIETIFGAGHWIHIDRPELLLSRVRQHISKAGG